MKFAPLATRLALRPSAFGFLRLRVLPLAVLLSLARGAAAEPDARLCLTASHASVEALEAKDVTEEYQQLSTCSHTACPDLVQEECKRRLDLLASQVSLYRFSFEGPAGDAARDVTVSIDGGPDKPYLVNTRLALGPGLHALVFRSAGSSIEQRLHAAGKGEATEVRLVWPGVAAAPKGASAPDSAEHDRYPWNATKTTAVVLGGVGVVSLAIAGGYTLSAIAKRDRAASVCPDVCRSPEDAERWVAAEDAGSMATLWSTVGWLGFTAGGVLLAVAFYEDAQAKPSIQLGVGPGNLVLNGKF